MLFTTVAGGTGVGITLALILMVSTAAPQIRRSYFELFWYTHHLFVVFYVCLCMHGYSGFIEKQTNYDVVRGHGLFLLGAQRHASPVARSSANPS